MKTIKQKKLFLLSIVCLCLALFISGCRDEQTRKSSSGKKSQNQAQKTRKASSGKKSQNQAQKTRKAAPKQNKYTAERYFDVEYSGPNCTITNYTGQADRVLKIPPTIKGHTVTVIGKHAFSNSKSFTKVIIPDTVKVIGEWAFDNCTNLENVTIPESVLEIHTFAFTRCPYLRKVAIPKHTEVDHSFSKNCKVTRY